MTTTNSPILGSSEVFGVQNDLPYDLFEGDFFTESVGSIIENDHHILASLKDVPPNVLFPIYSAGLETKMQSEALRRLTESFGSGRLSVLASVSSGVAPICDYKSNLSLIHGVYPLEERVSTRYVGDTYAEVSAFSSFLRAKEQEGLIIAMAPHVPAIRYMLYDMGLTEQVLVLSAEGILSAIDPIYFNDVVSSKEYRDIINRFMQGEFSKNTARVLGGKFVHVPISNLSSVVPRVKQIVHNRLHGPK